MRKAASYRTAA